MSKLIFVVFTVCVCVCALFSGCTLTTHFGNAENPEKSEKSALAPSSNTVREKAKKAPEAENEFTISLAENPTTGFSWQYEIADSSMLALENDYYEADKQSGSSVGKGGMRYLTFVCKKSGDSVIVLTYRRPWQGGETAETREVSVSYTKGDTISWQMQKIR